MLSFQEKKENKGSLSLILKNKSTILLVLKSYPTFVFSCFNKPIILQEPTLSIILK